MINKIWSWLSSIFKREYEEDMININNDACSASIEIKDGAGLEITATANPVGSAATYPTCCVVCDTPEVATDLYEGTSFIPFTLAMPDGTKVLENRIGGVGYVYDGKGVVELNEPLSAGSVVQLSVSEEGCNVTGEAAKVKAANYECVESNSSDCNINFKSFQAETFGGSLGKIVSIELDSNYDLYYRINDSVWVDDISLLPPFILNKSISLGVKSKADPSCRKEIMIGAVKTSIEGIPDTATIISDRDSVFGDELATLSGTCSTGSILWSTGETTPSIMVGAGSYTAKCVSDAGESASSPPKVIAVGIEEIELPSAPVITADKTVIFGSELATLSGTCATGNILWSTGATGDSIIVSGTGGNYTATCVNALGSSPYAEPISISWSQSPPSIPNNKVYDASKTQAYPEYGVGSVVYAGTDGNIIRTFLNLEVFEDAGVVKLRDLAWDAEFENFDGKSYNNKNKIYTYGYFDESDPSTYFTKSEMQSGVDISGFVGRDITITAIALSDTGEFIDFKQQNIYLGSNDISITTESSVNGGTTYYRYPSGTVIDLGMHHNIRDNVSTAIPVELNVANQMNYVDDIVNPLLPSKNIFSKVSDNNVGKLIVEIADDFYEGLGSGSPSTDFELKYEQRLQLVKQQSDQSIPYDDITNPYVSIGLTNNDKAAWLFFNNEKGGHPDFEEMVRRTILSFPLMKVEAWLESDFSSYNAVSSISDADRKSNIYTALSLPESTSWSDFKNNPATQVVFNFKDSGLSKSLNVQSANSYEFDNRWFSLYYRINELIAIKKFNYFDDPANKDANGNDKIWSMSQWYKQETLSPQVTSGTTLIQNSRLYKFHEGLNESRMWFEKPSIDSPAMYNHAIVNLIILGEYGGSNVWAEANNHVFGKFGDNNKYSSDSNGLDAPFDRTFGQYGEILGIFNQYYVVDSSGGTTYQDGNAFPFPSYFVDAVGTNALNNWLQAVKIAGILHNSFANSEIGFAEFQHNGAWRVGEDATTEAAIQDKTPVIVYLKNAQGEVLFLPLMHGNTINRGVQVRLPNTSKEYTVVVEGSYVVPQVTNI